MPEKELEIERQHVHVFDRKIGYPVLDIINYVVNNYNDKPKIITDKYNRKIISSYKYQRVSHNASGFDKYIVLNSFPTSYTSVKMKKTSRGLLKLSFRAGFVWEGDRELPKYIKFVCSKYHNSGSLKEIQKDYNIQPHFLKGEYSHDLITLSTKKKDENHWKLYLIDDVLGLVFVISKHGNCILNLTGV